MRKKLSDPLMIVLAVVWIFLGGVLMGAKCDKEQAEGHTTYLASLAMEAGLNLYIEPAVALECSEQGSWTTEECAMWDDHHACTKETVEDILPWAIGKLYDKLSKEEKRRLLRYTIVQLEVELSMLEK